MTKKNKLLKKIIDEYSAEKKSKIEFAFLFVWYHYVATNNEISITEINNYFAQNELSKYNTSYLRDDLRKSKYITKGSQLNYYKPHRNLIVLLNSKYEFVIEKDEEIDTDDTILPNELFKNSRGYLENLSKQINGCYNNNLFDGCAVLMRRLLEVLLIHSYEAEGKESLIIENDGYRNLSYIINFLISNKAVKLSKEAMEVLDEFRQVGNFSAHKIQYNAKRKDIDNLKLKYRMTIEELLYKSKIKK